MSGPESRGDDALPEPDLLGRLLALWAEPPPDGEAGVAAFRRVYSDPVLLNGTELPVAALADRARMLHAAFEDLRIDQVLQRVDAPGRLVIAFRQQGRHVGPLPTPLGTIPPTGRTFDTQTIDVLTVASDRITEIWVVADELGRLMQLGAVQLADPPAGSPQE